MRRRKRTKNPCLFSAILVETASLLGIVLVSQPMLAVDWINRIRLVSGMKSEFSPSAANILTDSEPQRSRQSDYHEASCIPFVGQAGAPREKGQDFQRY